MKYSLLIASLFIISLSAISQRTSIRAGYDPANPSKPGYKYYDTNKTLVALSPLSYDGDSTISLGIVPVSKGGTGLTAFTTGDIIYSSATNALTRLPIGTNGQTLQIAGGIPSWATVATGGGTGSGWALTGNSGTVYGNYLGTTDAQSLRLGTNGVTRMTIDSLYGATNWNFPYSANGINFAISNGSPLSGGKAFNIYITGGATKYSDFGSGFDLNIGPASNIIANFNSGGISFNKQVIFGTTGWVSNAISTFQTGVYTGLQYQGSTGTYFYSIKNQNGTYPFLISNIGNTIIGGAAGVVNTDTVSTSALTVKSHTQGTIPYSRLTTTERNTIPLDATNDGLAVFDITLHKLFINEGGTWAQK